MLIQNGLLIAMGLVVILVFISNTRRIREYQNQMKVMKALLSMHQRQFRIARRLLIVHHLKLEFDDGHPDKWIWDETDWMEQWNSG